MGFHIKDRGAYQKVAEAFKKQQNGATVADIVAKTGLPLHTVKELVPLAADEYSARLQVTESGEILYSFPRGFASKYRGFRASLRKFGEKLFKGLKIAGSALFKIWIMLMLVGYFVLFMLVALASLLISVAGSSNSNSRSEHREGGGGLFFASFIFDLIIRLWFYSELTKAVDQTYYGERTPRPKGKPLYKAIFSFVFGDEDPNKGWTSKEKQSVLAYLQANQGVISLPEFMTLTGRTPQAAETAITAYCAEFGGLPEATEDGTVVYQFSDMLLRADRRDRSYSGASLLKRLPVFSSNTKGMNVWFCLLNGVNLAFGSYFLFNALNTGAITAETQKTASYIYHVAYVLAQLVADNPLPFITVGLGAIPVIFSVLFWLIPAVRYQAVKKGAEAIKLENLRKAGYGRIWSAPGAVASEDITAEADICRPKNLPKAQDTIIKEMGSYTVPEVSLTDSGTTVYAFTELEREKEALQKYRNRVHPQTLGKTVFDSET
ncbi:MAG: hypothetical protein LBG73_03105 [Spirochaetaceae bacterium]|jgi:hypothetical protein|nr:hypothetical protein [Spirochaetaceae bacterium]